MNNNSGYSEKHPLQAQWITSLIKDAPELPLHHEYLDDLYHVGPWKPIGDLPLDAVTEICGEDVSDVVRICEAQGLSVYISEDPNEYHQSSITVYDQEALKVLLGANLRTLENNKWPSDPREFVVRVSDGMPADPDRQADLYTLIAWCFRASRPQYARPFTPEGVLDQEPVIPEYLHDRTFYERVRRYGSHILSALNP